MLTSWKLSLGGHYRNFSFFFLSSSFPITLMYFMRTIIQQSFCIRRRQIARSSRFIFKIKCLQFAVAFYFLHTPKWIADVEKIIGFYEIVFEELQNCRVIQITRFYNDFRPKKLPFSRNYLRKQIISRYLQDSAIEITGKLRIWAEIVKKLSFYLKNHEKRLIAPDKGLFKGKSLFF